MIFARFLFGPGLALALGLAPAAYAEEPAKVTITLKDHKFSPAEPTAPAGKPIVLEVVNQDGNAGRIREQGFRVEKAGRRRREGHGQPLAAEGRGATASSTTTTKRRRKVSWWWNEAVSEGGEGLDAGRADHRLSRSHRSRPHRRHRARGDAGRARQPARRSPPASRPASSARRWWRRSRASIANALAGVGQEIFNASILIVAVVMLVWHNVWMASHGRELAAEVKRVGEAVRVGRARSSPSASSAPSR